MGQTLRPFIFWDGEGLTENNRHPYSLFGCSTGDRIKYIDLSTLDCLSLILEVEAKNPRAIHVGYSFGYDVNMIIRDLNFRQLLMLKEKGSTSWKGFNLEYIPRKWFSVTRGRISAKIFDTFLFFNCGFAKALGKYGIGTPEDIARIESGKEERPNFTWADIDSIEKYWETELKYGVELITKLRDILYGAGFRIQSWHGPGALASYALNHHGTLRYMDKGIDRQVNEASQYAMFGGRFQPFLAGYYEGPVHERDINSAYAYAFSRLPDLSSGKWLHIYSPDPIDSQTRRMGLYKIRRLSKPGRNPMPLPHRSKGGQVTYPPCVEGWYFAPEAALVSQDSKAEFMEAWVYEDDGTYPFSWVSDAYDERLALQLANDPTEKALKWMLAALYGQCAQRTGWERTGGPPKWHQLEWAGTVTAECRAMVYAAAIRAKSSLVSIDTDGFMSTEPVNTLPNGVGNKLGQWKKSEYTGLLFIQNGIYWLRDQEGFWLPPKSRGIPRKKLDFSTVYPIICANQNIRVTQHMFTGFGLAISQNLAKWRTWTDVERSVTFGGNGKAYHKTGLCPTCQKGIGWGEGLHPLLPVIPLEIESSKHKLPWLTETIETEQDIMKKWGIFNDS
jgi:hypothetical protein